ncbi:glycosyltransferase family 4 protein [Nocardioides phosphati]|uniref:glycosyltransferase family 4 protein n=1 Tax=Nocardioides phosphati TaxID=1867775 RepID=UPI00166B826B|nr:MraY family glycosyltransferase [Nocardioides phosphati]
MREYLVVFLVAGSVTYLLTVIAREIALRTGAVAQVRDRDMHVIPIPYFGGIAMLGGMVAAYLVARHLPFLSAKNPGNVFRDAGVVLVAGALICAIGVLDDLLELDALTKLGGQVVAAGLLILFGVTYLHFPLPGIGQFSLPPDLASLLTVVTVVATVNAVNFVDGLDGLAAGVVGIGASAFLLYCYQLANLNGQVLAMTAALLCAALAGACAGFLPHNFHPARLFMGDSGSMLLGLVLAASALTLTGQFPASAVTRGGDGAEASLLPTLLPILLPLSILIVPMADLVLAVIRRTRRGQMFYHPDKQHLHHRMLEIGHSHRRAVLVIWLWAALVGYGTVVASLYSGPVVFAALAVWFAVTVFLTVAVPRVHLPHRPEHEREASPT